MPLSPAEKTVGAAALKAVTHPNPAISGPAKAGLQESINIMRATETPLATTAAQNREALGSAVAELLTHPDKKVRIPILKGLEASLKALGAKISAPRITSSESEYIKPSDVKARFALSRSYLYTLLAEGKIKSKVLRRMGNIRGTRLVSVESIRQFIESLPEK